MAIPIGNCPLFLRVFACFLGLVKADEQKMDAFEKNIRFRFCLLAFAMKGRDFGEVWLFNITAL
jgi:hypothetical protein